VTRLREELEGAAARPVVAVTGADVEPPPPAGVYVGTEAALHRVTHADVVVFLELDSELLAPRFAAAEQALALIVRAGRLAPRVMIQSFDPDHEVLRAAVAGDPDIVINAERVRRRLLSLPPFGALAVVSGGGADEFAQGLAAVPAIELAALDHGRTLVRAPDHATLGRALAVVDRPTTARLRIEVDPARV
jgi:primosomal protein N' (replication factor Y)